MAGVQSVPYVVVLAHLSDDHSSIKARLSQTKFRIYIVKNIHINRYCKYQSWPSVEPLDNMTN